MGISDGINGACGVSMRIPEADQQHSLRFTSMADAIAHPGAYIPAYRYSSQPVYSRLQTDEVSSRRSRGQVITSFHHPSTIKTVGRSEFWLNYRTQRIHIRSLANLKSHEKYHAP